MSDTANSIDPKLIDHWVTLAQVPINERDLLPAGGPVLAYLYFERESQQVSAWVETAVVISRGRITPIGLPLGRPGDVALILRGVNIDAPKAVSPSECERLRLLPPLWIPPTQPTKAPLAANATTISLMLAVRDAPDDADAHCELGVHLAEVGDTSRAEHHLCRAVELSSEEPFFLSNFASFLANTQRDEAALATFSAALVRHRSVYPVLALDDPEYWLRGSIEVGMAKSLVSLGRVDEARAVAAHWLDHADHGPELIEWLDKVSGDDTR